MKTTKTWTERVVNREILWSVAMDGLSYKVVAERTNYKDLIIKPECSKVVLHEGLKQGVYTADKDLLKAIADTWAALVLLAPDEAYKGHNASETSDTAWVTETTGTNESYPYFQHT